MTCGGLGCSAVRKPVVNAEGVDGPQLLLREELVFKQHAKVCKQVFSNAVAFSAGRFDRQALDDHLSGSSTIRMESLASDNTRPSRLASMVASMTNSDTMYQHDTDSTRDQ